MVNIKKSKIKKVEKKSSIKPKKTKAIILKSKAKKTVVKKNKTALLSKRVDSAKLTKTIFAQPPRERKKSDVSFKRCFYMLLAIVLGILISMVTNSFLELIYLKRHIYSVNFPFSYDFAGFSFLLPIYVGAGLLMLGIIFGIWLGIWGWRTVYIEKNHRIFRKK